MSQKSILAFFGKPGAKVAAKPIASKKKTPSKPSVEPEKRKRTPESKGAPAPDSAPLVTPSSVSSTNAVVPGVQVADCIRIKWSDGQFYAAKVRTVGPPTTVVFENGEEHEVDMASTKWSKLEPESSPSTATPAVADKAKKSVAKAARQPIARKQLMASDSESELDVDSDDDFKAGESDSDSSLGDLAAEDSEDDVTAIKAKAAASRTLKRAAAPSPRATPKGNKPKKLSSASPASPRTPSTVITPSTSHKRPSSAGGRSPGTPAASSPATPGAPLPGSFGSHDHHNLTWLQPEHIRDAEGRRPEDPGFDARTLKVPDAYLRKLTPGLRVWWEFKSQNMDAVLFYRVGKFYETYHMDSDVLVKEMDAVYMKGTMAHAGFPERSYAKFCEALVSRGYRVARIEQTETPEMLKERNAERKSQGLKQDKTVRRELCSIRTCGTRVLGQLDFMRIGGGGAEASKGSNSLAAVTEHYRDRLLEQPPCNLLLAVFEIWSQPEAKAAQDEEMAGRSIHAGAQSETPVPVRIGVCAIDSMTGQCTVAEFDDDKQRMRLRRFLATNTPSEILYLSRTDSSPAGGATVVGLTATTRRVLKYDAPGALWTSIRQADLLAPEALEEEVRSAGYFKPKTKTTEMVIPDVLQRLFQGVAKHPTVKDAVSDTPSVIVPMELDDAADETNESKQLAVQPASLCAVSVGATIKYLRRCQVDHQVLSYGRIEQYTPADVASSTANSSAESEPEPSTETGLKQDSRGVVIFADESARTMVLDGATLLNLEILSTVEEGARAGSLVDTVEHCRTAFGRRLFDLWISSPLRSAALINERLDGVEELMQHTDFIGEAGELMKQLPDLERLMASLHGMSQKPTLAGSTHPESRAVYYEMPMYSKIKIAKLAQALMGFKKAASIRDLMIDASGDSKFKSRILRQIGHEAFPDMRQLVSQLERDFELDKACKNGQVTPRKGMFTEYDEALDTVDAVKRELDEYLKEQKHELGISLSYFHTQKDRYQIEIPMTFTDIPSSFQLKSQRKGSKTKPGVRRYFTPHLEGLLAQLAEAEDTMAECRRDALRLLFGTFMEHYPVWMSALKCLARLDVLMNLALWSAVGDGGGEMCRPVIMDPHTAPDQRPFLEMTRCRHPCVRDTFSGGSFIPNDLVLGREGGQGLGLEGLGHHGAPCMLLTGPNMGGKSTLLRQTCLSVILAQMGAFVPAAELRLSSVDRIFTRVGASDRILAGQSTFFVELSETATILQHATPQSLVILDELGRGTSTFDGNAIAYAVVQHLLQAGARTMFATHYHALTRDFEGDRRVAEGHMGCLVEDGEDNGDGPEKTAIPHVTFLYKYADGACPKSYGMNVAKLAHLPDAVTANAAARSAEFEQLLREAEQHVSAISLLRDARQLISGGESDDKAVTALGEKLKRIDWRK